MMLSSEWSVVVVMFYCDFMLLLMMFLMCSTNWMF